MRLIFGDVLAPQHRARFGIDDHVERIDRLPDQHAPSGARDAGLGREIHLVGRRRPVARTERRSQAAVRTTLKVQLRRIEGDVQRGGADRVGRIAKVIGKRRRIEPRREIVDHAHDLARSREAGLDLAAEDRNAVDPLFKVREPEIPVGIHVIGGHDQSGRLIGADADQTRVLGYETAQDLGPLVRCRRREEIPACQRIRRDHFRRFDVLVVFDLERRHAATQRCLAGDEPFAQIGDARGIGSRCFAERAQISGRCLIGPDVVILEPRYVTLGPFEKRARSEFRRRTESPRNNGYGRDRSDGDECQKQRVSRGFHNSALSGPLGRITPERKVTQLSATIVVNKIATPDNVHKNLRKCQSSARSTSN